MCHIPHGVKRLKLSLRFHAASRLIRVLLQSVLTPGTIVQ